MLCLESIVYVNYCTKNMIGIEILSFLHLERMSVSLIDSFHPWL